LKWNNIKPPSPFGGRVGEGGFKQQTTIYMSNIETKKKSPVKIIVLSILLITGIYFGYKKSITA
jgi:hypothetical protein